MNETSKLGLRGNVRVLRMACTIDFRCLDEGFGGKTYKRKRSEQAEEELNRSIQSQNNNTKDDASMEVEEEEEGTQSKRQAVSSSDNPDKPVVFGKPTYDGVIAGKVSGRKWKQPRTHRASAVYVTRKGTTYEQRMKQKEIKRAYTERITELKEEIRHNKVEKRKKRQERDRRKQDNILRSGTKLQKITNPKTLKKIAKSKHKKLLKVVPDDLLNNNNNKKKNYISAQFGLGLDNLSTQSNPPELHPELGDSLCSGNLHPDAVLHQEQCFMTSKKSYYSELKKYHKGMVGNLLMWKEKWASCKDPEKEIVRKIWRSRKQVERNMSTDANECRFHDAEDDFAAMSESGSWATDEKAGSSSDDQNLMRKHGELQTCVSKEQHQRVRSSMKNSSNSIQSRSLNHVLGNLDTFHANHLKYLRKQSGKSRMSIAAVGKQRSSSSICKLENLADKEMANGSIFGPRNGRKFKVSLGDDEAKETALNMLLDLTVNRAADFEATITVEVEEKGTSDSLIQEQIDDGAEYHNPDIALEDEEKENPDTVVQGMTDNDAAKLVPTIEDDNESLPVSTQNQHLQPIPSLNGRHEFSPMDLDSDNNVNVETDDIPHNVSEYAENLNHVDIAVSQGDPLSSTSYVRPALSIGHPRCFEEQLARRIDLESDNQEEGTEKAVLHRQPIERPCFNPYTNKDVQDRNELLQHSFKAQDGLPYSHEQKQKGLDFLPETGQFSGHVGQHLHPSVSLDLRQKRLNDLYMHQNIQEKMFSDVVLLELVEHLCCLVTDIEVDEDVEQEDKPGVQNLSISVFYKRQSSQVKVLFISLLLRAFTSNSAESSDRDDNSGLSISDCMEKCWNNCNCVGFTTSNSNASPEKFSGFQIKHSRISLDQFSL
ncbi:unnamed protein product [Camellia sinensis]